MIGICVSILGELGENLYSLNSLNKIIGNKLQIKTVLLQRIKIKRIVQTYVHNTFLYIYGNIVIIFKTIYIIHTLSSVEKFNAR